jgi:hypothetical protein
MAEREKPGDGHDWIEARRKCTLERKFEDLVNRVKEDAQKARGVRVDHSENGREIHVSYGSRPARGTDVRMSFRLEADKISVGDRGKSQSVLSNPSSSRIRCLSRSFRRAGAASLSARSSLARSSV